MTFLLLTLLLLLHALSHIFLLRFFKWHDPDQKLKFLHKIWFQIFLMIPPVALVFATFLIITGLILKK
jgi:hypothetical protein